MRVGDGRMRGLTRNGHEAVTSNGNQAVKSNGNQAVKPVASRAAQLHQAVKSLCRS